MKLRKKNKNMKEKLRSAREDNEDFYASN